MAELLSNGDENLIGLEIQNKYGFIVHYQIIDELPVQLQIRDFLKQGTLSPKENRSVTYFIRPTKRGEYCFGKLHLYIEGVLGLIKRHYSFGDKQVVPVYPSLIQMQKYAFLAVSKFAAQFGIKRVRRIGQSKEFEHIKDYTRGDDIRAINWKATARRNNLMVNHYEDEKSQPLLCIIDKGRAMRLTFEKLSLLDYAINSTLALSNIALQKSDKVGLLTFSDRLGTYIPPENSAVQLKKLSVALYNQKTSWGESSYEFLYSCARAQLKQRSFLILFSEFDSLPSLERQLPYLKKLNKFHLVLVVFFEDTELIEILKKPVYSIKEVYMKTISGKFSLEKQIIAKEIGRHGILSLLTTPKALSINLINKYLEIKNQGRL